MAFFIFVENVTMVHRDLAVTLSLAALLEILFDLFGEHKFRAAVVGELRSYNASVSHDLAVLVDSNTLRNYVVNLTVVAFQLDTLCSH